MFPCILEKVLETSGKEFDEFLENTTSEIITRSNKLDHDMFKYTVEHLTESADDEIFYEEGKNIIESIGNAIIELFKKLKEFFEKISRSIRQTFFSNKTDMEKVEYVIKKRPELADQIKVAVDTGALDIKSWKDIHAADEDISRVLQDLADGKIGTAAAEQKCRERMEKLDKAVSITKNILGVATAVITLYMAVKAFKSDILKHEADYESNLSKAKARAEANDQYILKKIKAANPNKKIVDGMSQKEIDAIKDAQDAVSRLTTAQRLNFKYSSELTKIMKEKGQNTATLFSKFNALFNTAIHYNDKLGRKEIIRGLNSELSQLRKDHDFNNEYARKNNSRDKGGKGKGNP